MSVKPVNKGQVPTSEIKKECIKIEWIVFSAMKFFFSQFYLPPLNTQ